MPPGYPAWIVGDPLEDRICLCAGAFLPQTVCLEQTRMTAGDLSHVLSLNPDLRLPAR